MARHVVDLTDEAWDALEQLALARGLLYKGRPSRTAALEELVAGVETPAPVPATQTSAPSFDEAWEALSAAHQRALNASPSSSVALRRFYDLVTGQAS